MGKPDHKETKSQINRTERKEKELEQEANRKRKWINEQENCLQVEDNGDIFENNNEQEKVEQIEDKGVI